MNDAAVIHIVDDDDSLRTALARLLRASGFETRCHKSAGEFLLAERPDAPGCVILDLHRHGPNGIEPQLRPAEDRHPLPVVFLTGHGDVAACVRAMKAGAVDVLTKPVRREELLAAVQVALVRDAEQRQARERVSRLQQRFETLTSREREVLALVVTGRLNKEIAGALGNSERTVKAHRAHIMDKMRAGSIAELVRAADELRRYGAG